MGNEAPLFQELWKLSIDTLMPDFEIDSKMCSLNTKQREIFEVIIKWARDYVKHFFVYTLTAKMFGAKMFGENIFGEQIVRWVFYQITKFGK